MATASSAIALALMVTLAACGPGSRHQAAASGSPRAVSSGSGPAAYQLPAGTSAHTIRVGGTRRTFLTYRPAGLSPGAPLVVMLHASNGSASQAERDYHWDAQADRGHFLVAYPGGLHQSWNAGGCCGYAGYHHADDIGFISAMIAAIEGGNPVDRDRIYATGISNGGMMAYALACQTTIFAAIGPDSATEAGPCSAPAPISVIHIHGTADPIIPYDGRHGLIRGPSIPELNRTWRRIDQCAAPVIKTAGKTTTSIAACPAGRTVELITIAGAGHQWPGSVPGLGSAPSRALNATRVIWDFFSQHHRNP